MTDITLAARVVPPIRGSRGHRVLERNLIVYRRMWMVILSGFFEPVFYLFSIGIGVGRLVQDVQLTDGSTVSYLEFVAPALLASSAMNGAVFESTWNIFFKFKYDKLYDTMLATPLRPIDIAVGEIATSLIRGGLYAVGFMIVMMALGLATSWWAILAIPAALLIGFAFAAVGMAATTFMRSWQDFDFVTLVTLPLFLFSATFYPLDVYPPAIQTITRFSPLYHGAELIRGLTLGAPAGSLVGHVAFLVAMGAVGMWFTNRRLGRLLLV